MWNVAWVGEFRTFAERVYLIRGNANIIFRINFICESLNKQFCNCIAYTEVQMQCLPNISMAMNGGFKLDPVRGR